MKYQKYLIAFLIIVITFSLIGNCYQSRLIDNLQVDPNTEVKALIRGLHDKMDDYDKKIDNLTPDSVYNANVEYITNHYKNNYYDKIATVPDSQFYILLDSILTDNRNTPFERGY